MRDKLGQWRTRCRSRLENGLIYGVQTRYWYPKKDMNILMTLNNNGQAITLSKKLADKGAIDGAGLAKLMAKENATTPLRKPSRPVPMRCGCITGWRHGINPEGRFKVITVPPPQMVANMRVDNMDGYCVGEPWNHRAIADGIGITAATTQDIWKDHPEKFWKHHRRVCAEISGTPRVLLIAAVWKQDAGSIHHFRTNRKWRKPLRKILRQHLGRRD